MEIEVGAQDVVAQQTPILQLADGVSQTGNGHGILGTDVDVAVFSLDRIACDHHALDELEGVAFHDGAVHEGTGVALVAVTDDIALHLLLTGDLLPLLAGGEAAAAAAAETGLVDLVDDAVAAQLEHGLLQGLEAAGSQVLVQGLGVEAAAVLQNDAGLLGDEGDLLGLDVSGLALVVQQPLDDLVAQDTLLKDLLAVLGLHLDILDGFSVLLDADQGAQLTEALAAGLLDADYLLVVVTAAGGEHELHAGGVLDDILKDLMDLVGAGGDTAGAGADQNTAAVAIDLRAGSFRSPDQFFSSFNHQPLPLSSAMTASAFSGVMEG